MLFWEYRQCCDRAKRKLRTGYSTTKLRHRHSSSSETRVTSGATLLFTGCQSVPSSKFTFAFSTWSWTMTAVSLGHARLSFGTKNVARSWRNRFKSSSSISGMKTEKICMFLKRVKDSMKLGNVFHGFCVIQVSIGVKLR
jgi:hypothetical protein